MLTHFFMLYFSFSFCFFFCCQGNTRLSHITVGVIKFVDMILSKKKKLANIHQIGE